MIDLPPIPARPDDGRQHRLILHVGDVRTVTYFVNDRTDLATIGRKAAGYIAGSPAQPADNVILQWEWR
jgi:hypothetical protein